MSCGNDTSAESEVARDLEDEVELHALHARLRSERGPPGPDAEAEATLRRLLGPPDG